MLFNTDYLGLQYIARVPKMIKSYRSKRRKIQEEINLYESNLFNNDKSTADGLVYNNVIDQPTCSWQSVSCEPQNDDSIGLSSNDKLVLGSQSTSFIDDVNNLPRLDETNTDDELSFNNKLLDWSITHGIRQNAFSSL
ncbi:hypothetical protein ACI65C_013646 [Semiaphis heraclei]